MCVSESSFFVVLFQKCRESSSDADADCSSQQSVNDVMLTAKLKEVDLSCQLNECREKLLITEQQVHNSALLSLCRTGVSGSMADWCVSDSWLESAKVTLGCCLLQPPLLLLHR